MFRPPSKPLSCVRQCNSRYHSAMEHGSFLAVFPAPLTRPALPSQSFRHRRRSPHRVCPASRTRPAAAIRRFGRSMGVFSSTNEASSASSEVSHASRPDNYLSLRRADDGSVNSAVVCSLRFNPSSGRPAAPATPSPKGYTKRRLVVP